MPISEPSASPSGFSCVVMRNFCEVRISSITSSSSTRDAHFGLLLRASPLIRIPVSIESS